MNNLYPFSEEELELINNFTIKNGSQLTASSWESEDFESLRKSIKRDQLDRQNHTCVYCRQIFHSNNGSMWNIDHIIPRSENSNLIFSSLNLCVSCLDCNTEKSDKRVTYRKSNQKSCPRNSDTYKIIHPHLDVYQDHIFTVTPGKFYKHKTDKGRRTIEICGLLRFHRFAGYDKSVDRMPEIKYLVDQFDGPNKQEAHRRLLEILLDSAQ